MIISAIPHTVTSSTQTVTDISVWASVLG